MDFQILPRGYFLGIPTIAAFEESARAGVGMTCFCEVGGRRRGGSIESPLKKWELYTCFVVLMAMLLMNRAFAEDPFNYRDIVQKAESLASQSFVPQLQEFSPDLEHLDYD